jgi:hypothetical protein
MVTLAATALPQPAQKRSPGTLLKPQAAHTNANCEPHAVQKRPPALFSVLQVGQSINQSSPSIVLVDPGSSYRRARGGVDERLRN